MKPTTTAAKIDPLDLDLRITAEKNTGLYQAEKIQSTPVHLTVTPKALHFFRRSFWPTLSKAFAKSR